MLNRAFYGTRLAGRCFGKLVAEVLKDARFEAVAIVPNLFHHPQKNNDTVVHGDDFVAVTEKGNWITSNMSRDCSGDQARRVDWIDDGFTWRQIRS